MPTIQFGRNIVGSFVEVCAQKCRGQSTTLSVVDLAELEVDSIPLNLLTPIPGTPLEGTPPLSVEEVRRIVAVFRYINPTAWIRMAAGRGRFADGGAILFRAGANSAITGDMLTTTGTNIAQDLDLMKQGGFLNGNQA